MPIQGYTPNKNLAKIAQNSTDNWDVWSNQNLDTLDEPTLIYNIAAAENLNAGDVAVIKDDGTGAKKAYLAVPAAYSVGDPLGIALASATAGGSVRLSLDGRVQNAGWSFGPSSKFVYLSNTGAVTTTPTATKIGFVLSSTAIYFTLQAPPGGQTDTVSGANGIQNTGDNVNAVLAPVYGSTANTVCQGNDSRLHAQNTDGGTSASSFEINYTANSARILTTGLTANRDYTLPDGSTRLVGESVPATITAQHSFSPTVAQAPFALGANAQGQLVTGLNADKLDGNDSTAFAPAANGVTNGDSHDHAGGDGAPIPLTSGVTEVLPIANGGTGQTTANAALNALLPSQAGKTGSVLMSDGSNSSWNMLPRPNLLTNGSLKVWQRGTSFTTAGYSADRWYADASGSSNFTVGRQAGPTGFQYAIRVQRNSGQIWTTALRLAQALTTPNSIAAQGLTVTLSFWARAGANYSPAGGTLLSRMKSGTGTDQPNANMLAGSWTGAANNDQNNTLTTSWQKFTHTWAIASSSTQIGVEFNATPTGTAGTNDWFEIGGIKLETGSIATDIEPLPVEVELERCLAYYEVIGGSGGVNDISVTGYATAGSELTGQIPIFFKVDKRAAPTLTLNGTWAVTNCGQPFVAAANVKGFTLQATSTSSGRVQYYTNSSDDYIIASAEL